jgi:hypothetical protein
MVYLQRIVVCGRNVEKLSRFIVVVAHLADSWKDPLLDDTEVVLPQ